MSREARGKALRDRMADMGYDESKLARATGKDRGTIRRVFAGEASVVTYDQLERWFDREERKNTASSLDTLGVNGGTATAVYHGKPPVVIHIEEGGSIAIEGPADTPEEVQVLKDLARDLMREMRERKPGR